MCITGTHFSLIFIVFLIHKFSINKFLDCESVVKT